MVGEREQGRIDGAGEQLHHPPYDDIGLLFGVKPLIGRIQDDHCGLNFIAESAQMVVELPLADVKLPRV